MAENTGVAAGAAANSTPGPPGLLQRLRPSSRRALQLSALVFAPAAALALGLLATVTGVQVSRIRSITRVVEQQAVAGGIEALD
ncbi:hypothetical protein EVJ50_01860 [Synechococcus sp. RSCCF101]|uniref:hypothetical protein n=1 Tax=Synechococcus sp. RSCCF101 TaxID=2511069 RepID=UPI001248AF91|nr:hypothetical protein [Synechococcus sp. RSCCF101]QEY31180.1 hypothetical protein EVJ50_01860 [Synechococcus sp. RSCCF101]